MHLYCGKGALRENAKVIALVANSLSCLFFLNMSDLLGRRGAIRLNSALVLVSLSLAFYLDNYYFKMGLIGIAFGCEGGLAALYIFMINEVSHSGSILTSKMSGYTLASFSFGIVALNVMSFYFKTANSLILAMIFCLMLMYYPNFAVLYESPMWLLKKNKIATAVNTLRKIAIFNSRILPETYFEEIRISLEEKMLKERLSGIETSTSDKNRFKLLFLDRESRKSLCILSVVSIGLFCNVYAMNTSVQDMGLNPIQFNGILVGFTQGIGFMFALRYLANTRRKAALILIQATMILSGFLLASLEFYAEFHMAKIFQGFIANVVISLAISAILNPDIKFKVNSLIKFSKFRILNQFTGTREYISAFFSFLFVANGESFPVQVKGIAVGLILFLGKLVGSLAPYINTISRHMRVHTMVGATFPLFVSITCTMFLRETLNPNLQRKQPLINP